MAKTKEVSRADPARPKANGKASGSSNALGSKQQALLDALPATLVEIFGQSQHSLTTHRKLVNNLHKVFLACCEIQEAVGKGSDGRIKLTGEKAFRDGVLDMLDRVVACKKGVVQADRVVKFVAAYCGFASEHDPEAGDADEDEATPTMRFLVRVAKYLLGGFESKNKMVRWRCVQLLAYVVESMAEMDDDLFRELREKLLVRVRDKEAIVRQQAAIALMKFRPVDGEDEDNSDSEEESVNDALVDLMIHDPSPEVRRTILHNLAAPPSPALLPVLLTRLRDVDPLTRRTLYRDLIAASRAAGPDVPPVMPADPARAFSLRQRRAILRGLKDREPGVQKEASWLAAAWVRDGCGGSVEALLHRLEVVTCAASSSSRVDVAEAAVIAWINQGGEVPPFDDAWWTGLTPEKACLLRVLVQHYQKEGDDKALDEVMPVVMALAFRAEQAFAQLVATLEVEAAQEADGEDTEHEGGADAGKRKAQAFIVSELMKVAMHADYGDEIGRRKMFNLLREMIANPLLPFDLIPAVLDALLKLSSNERDFMRVVVELVQELMESAGGDASLAGRHENSDDETEDGDIELDEDGGVSMKKRKPVKVAANVVLDTEKAAQHLRILAIVHALLERALGSIQENTSLFGVVHEMIIPAVRSKDAAIREQGLLCLGLCSFLDKRMALDSFAVLANQSTEAEGEVQIKVIQILFDQFMLYGMNFMEAKGAPSEQVVDFLMQKLDDRPEVQATAAVGFSKLMLSGMLTDAEVIKALVLVYFSPETAGNQELRQCLSYFFPVYCYSSPANQRRLQSIIIETIEILDGVHAELDDKTTMLTPSQIAVQLIDWTDPSKAVETEGAKPDYEIHVDLAVGIVKELYKRTDKDFRKLLCQLLSKLNIMDEADDMKLRGLVLLLDSLQDRQPLADSVSRNAFTRFTTSFKKRFEEQLSALEELDLRVAEGMHAFYKYIDDFDNGSHASGSEQDDDEDGTDEDDEEADYKVKKKDTPKPQKKAGAQKQKGRTSILSRASSRRPRSSVASSDAGTESTAADTPAPRRSGRPRPQSNVHEQAKIQEEVDSLIGSDSEEDEVEVDDESEEE